MKRQDETPDVEMDQELQQDPGKEETAQADGGDTPEAAGADAGEEMDDEDEEGPKESWTDFYKRRLKESAKTAMPNIAWYLAENIFKEKAGIGTAYGVMPYNPSGFVIPLPGHYLNIWTLRDPKEKLENTLGLSSKEIEKVNYYACHIVTDSSCPLKPGTILTENDLTKVLEEYGDSFHVGMGAEGLMEYAANTGRQMPGIMEYLPIIYPSGDGENLREKRFFWEFRDELSYLYVMVMDRMERIRKLEQLNAADIIMRNERRMMQELLDSVIQNGLRGKFRTGNKGIPTYSWNDMVTEV